MNLVATRIARIGLGLILSVSHAEAATFVVNSTADPGSGSCDVVECTLREAIVAANATAATPDDIHFAIPGAGPHEILLASDLTYIASPVTIDGYTQPGSSPNTIPADQGYNDAVLRVGIVGCADCARPLQVSHGPTLIRGLAVWSAHVEGAGVTAAPVPGQVLTGEVRIEGCFLGLRADGLLPSEPFGRYGAYLVRPVHLGGTEPSQRNVIAGYYQFGVAAFSHDVVIEGNVIGMDAAGGNHDLVASGTAVAFAAGGVAGTTESGRLGGPLPGQRNWLATPNDSDLVVVHCDETDCHDGLKIQGNTFQTAVDGTPLPGLTYGGLVDVSAPAGTDVLVGGTGAGEGNIFGTSGQSGLSVLSFSIPDEPQGDGEFVGNRFLTLPPQAQGIPIRLKSGSISFDTVPLANDAGDLDEGPNRLQNWPEIVSVGIDGDSTTIAYRVDTTTAAAAYPLRVEFAQLSSTGTSGRFLYDTYEASDAQQLRTLVTSLPRGLILPFRATATSADGASSEFTPYVSGADVFADGLEDN